MILSTPEIMTVSVLLLVLAGSLLGSAGAFLSRGPAATTTMGEPEWPTANSSNFRPTHVVAQAAANQPRAKRTGPFGILVMLGLACAAGSAAWFSYNSPWATEVDLRHLAAGTHCEVARYVGLSEATTGNPGYFSRHDPDGDGIACEPSATLVLQAATVPTNLAIQTSGTPLVWPQDVTNSP